MKFTAFDAMWTFGLALNESIADFEEIGSDIEDFNYDRTDMADILFENCRRQRFFGSSVCISYLYCNL